MPAFAYRTSIRPCSAWALQNNAHKSGQDVTSSDIKLNLGSVIVDLGGCRSAPYTMAPLDKKSCTVARPMPEDAPVPRQLCEPRICC